MKDHVRANWHEIVLVCRKCSKKLDGGFGPDGALTLGKALRRAGGGKKRKTRFGVIEVGCLDICPKGAVVTVAGSRPGEWQLIPKGLPMEEVERRLGVTVV